MAFKSTLELYSAVVLPKLERGPMTLAELDVPAYAVRQLEAHGLIRRRNYRVAALAFEAWFLPEHLALLDETQPKRCRDLTDADFPPEDA